MMLLQMNFKKTSAIFFMAFCVFLFSQQSTQAADEYSVNTENKEKKELVNSSSASDRPLAIIRRFNPDVFVRGSNSSEWANATNAQPLFNADSLVTSDSGFAMIQFMDNSIVRMRPSSLLVIGGESRTRESTVTRLTMSAGEIFVSVTGIGESTEVVTPTAVAAVRGTNFAVLLRGTGDDRCVDEPDTQENGAELEQEDETNGQNGLEPTMNNAESDTTVSVRQASSFRDILEQGKRQTDDEDPCYDTQSTVVIGFDGIVEVNPFDSDLSFLLSSGDILSINEDGEVFELSVPEVELQELLREYESDGTDEEQETIIRTIELRFVNDAGEVEIITIEIEEPVENED